MQVTGKIEVIGEIKTFGANGFRKAELVLDVTEKPEWVEYVNIDITQDATDFLSNYKVGDTVTVSINLGGRKWVNPQGETKYFNSIKGWRIEKAGEETPSVPQPSGQDIDPLPF